MTPDEASVYIERDYRNKEVLFPYINGEDLNTHPEQLPSRWVINFGRRQLKECETNWPLLMQRVRELVKPARDKLINGDSSARYYATNWWLFGRYNEECYAAIRGMERVIALCIVTKHTGYASVQANWVYAHKCAIFPVQHIESSFSVIQSNTHEVWARKYSSSLKDDINYSPSDCFETFPFPQNVAPNLFPVSVLVCCQYLNSPVR